MEECETNQRYSLKKTGTVILDDQNAENSKQRMQKQRTSIFTRYPSHLTKRERKYQLQSDGSGVNDWLQKFLPYEILLFVFTILSRSDFKNVSRVCKHFRAVTQDPMFGWVTCYKAPCVPNILDRNLEDIDFDSLHLEYQMRNYKFNKEYQWSLHQSSGKIVTYLRHHLKSDKSIRKERIAEKLAEHAIRDTSFQLASGCCVTHPNLIQMKVRRLKPDPGCMVGNWLIDFQLHVHTLEQMANKGEDIPIMPVILDRIKAETLQITQSRIAQYIGNKQAMIPLKSSIASQQPPGLKDGINLYKYQLDAVRWMTSVESDIAANVPFKYAALHPWRAVQTELLFDLSNGVAVPSSKLAEHVTTIYPKGGVLADEVGLGKTLEILGLILSHPASIEETSDNASTIVELVTEESEEVAVEDIVDKLRFHSKATMIVCPNHLVQQWQEELTKFTQHNLKILAITAVPQLKSFSHTDLAEADVVLVAVQLFKYAAYQKLGKVTKKTAKSKSKSKTNYTARSSTVLTSLKRVRNKLANGQSADEPPLLEHFHWHRIVIDEAHEVLGDTDYQDIFSLFNSKYYWCVSGTPIPNEMVLNGILYFLKFPMDEMTLYSRYMFSDMFWNNLYWRNTKDSVKDEYTVPEVVEDLVLLEFTEVEKVLYEDFDEEDKRKLCSKLHSVGGCRSLSDVKEFKIEEKKKKIAQHKQTITSLEQEMDALPEKLKKADSDFKIQQAKRPEEYDRAWETKLRELGSIFYPLHLRKGQIPKQLTKEKAKLVREEELLKMYEAVTTYQENLAPAPCKEDDNQKSTNKKRKNQGTSMASKKQKTEAVDENNQSAFATELLDLVEQLGTKMGNLIYYLKKLWQTSSESRVIIFSQFDAVLAQVDEVLSQHGISTVSVKGNATRKSEALNQFKDTDSAVKVILLSLAKAASGSNLIQASHVVLIDPISGTKEEVEAVESQAIGRAYRQGQSQHVTVVRLLIKDTEEHAMYLKILAQDGATKDVVKKDKEKLHSSVELEDSMQSVTEE